MTPTGPSRFVKITFVRSDGFTQLLTIGAGESVLIGRDLTCDCRLEGRKVSRRHFRLTYRPDERLLVQDNASHNGTFVNGVRVMETILNGGEMLNVGEWEGRVEFTEGVPRRRTVPGLMPAVGEGEGEADSGGQNVFTNSQPAAPAPPLADPEPGGLPPPPGMDTGPASGAAPASPLPRAALVDAPAERSGFDGPTDPGMKAEAQAAPMPGPPDLSPGEGMGDTRVIDMSSVWAWQEAQKDSDVSAESMRAAPVNQNPIVKRLTQSHGALDFRGLRDLPKPTQEVTPGQTAAGINVDAIALEFVFKVTESLQAATTMDAFLADMSDSLCTAARAKAVVVLLPDAETGELVPRVVKNRRQEESVQMSRTVIEWAIQKKAAVTTEDAAADERFASGESVLRFDLKAVLVVPLMRQDDCIGAIYMTRDLPFSNTERDLVAALAHMIAIGLERSRLREQIASEERQRRALERFHAPDVVRKLMMEENAPVSAKHSGLFLEQLTATVLFCDLSGFTTFCEQHDPQTVGTLLNSYLGNMTELVFNHGGTVDKYIGDAIMCIFGAPFSAEDDAMRAVRCAVDMRRGFRKMVERGEFGEVQHPMDVHIGVNTGPVVAGTVGSSLRMEYTALGDTVNLAARLEGVAKAGQIVIGPATAELVREEFELNSLGKVPIKGKMSEVEVFEVPDQGEEPGTTNDDDFDNMRAEMTMDGDLSMIQGELKKKLEAAQAAAQSSEGAPTGE